ncbi:MAG: sulfurtransferase-like selenium metabolism protein YedF [Geobacter sp.]|nr:sulfurtransferase-like selenium metabolism protein YedF [Geobacter sp.]
MKTLDCRNMACPLPVVSVKRALEEAAGEMVRVLLDAGPPRENVTRFAVNRGYAVAEEPVDGGYALTIGSGERAPQVEEEKGAKSGPTVMLVSSDRMGEGADELGRLLMKNFIITLLDLDVLPDRIFFVNSGVLLTSEGSEVLDALERLGNRGVEVFSCGVCLDFFHCKEKLRAGAVTNMFTIAESLMKAGLVVKP